MKTIIQQSRDILTQIKLGSQGLQQQYGIIWGVLDGRYCLYTPKGEISNARALELIKTALES